MTGNKDLSESEQIGIIYGFVERVLSRKLTPGFISDQFKDIQYEDGQNALFGALQKAYIDTKSNWLPAIEKGKSFEPDFVNKRPEILAVKLLISHLLLLGHTGDRHECDRLQVTRKR